MNQDSITAKFDKWTVELLTTEVKQLIREQQHLKVKSAERPLTSWETSRLVQLLDELMEILESFVQVNAEIPLRQNLFS